MGGMLAGMVIMVGVPLVAYDTVMENGQELVLLNGGRFTIIAGVFSVLAVICYLLCYTLTTERVTPEASAEALQDNSVGKMLKNALSNRALISIIVASVIMLLAQLTMQSMAGYVYPNFYRNATAQSLSTGMMGFGMIAAAVCAKPLATRFGKAEISIVSNLFAAAVCAVLFVIRPENVWVYTGFQALCWLGLGIFSMINWALITDVIDYSELKNGIREDGSVYAMYSFARKLGQAASAGLTGILLGMIGYTQETAFDTEVVEGIFDISTVVPGAGFLLLALVLWFWYPLHKKQVDANVAALKEKHGRA
jgi:GPH family glycoside/pentoside/hexuronide:cation symporter